ncbi:MAG: hypothetical protein AUK48_10260 [Oscillatoriales cyanobacterium CG2_30_44_21]|nr:MAG: hypothetical protein AUK48_10260 [Oscillatoriales cyanobacterium CG2_30_44_21]
MPKPNDSELYARLRKEAKSPYRGLRIFIYLALGGSGFIGAVVFFAKLIAGNGDLGSNFANFALQLGAIALMVWLYRLDRGSAKK